MGRGNITPAERETLKKNKYVVDVTDNRIVYSNEFKKHFMSEYLDGKKPTAIFREAGFDTAILGSKRIERATARWKESYAAGSLCKYDAERYVCKHKVK